MVFKTELKYIVSIIICVAIITFSLAGFYMINREGGKGAYTSQMGRLDLESWKDYEDGIINLDGDWEFYPEQLIDDAADGKEKTYIKVPGKWNSYMGSSESADGSGTYRLVIKVPEDGVYALKTSTIRYACRIFANGVEMISMGNPSLDKDSFERDSRYMFGSCTSKDKEIELLIQVSNYGYRNGGIINSIAFGSFDGVERQDKIDLLIEGAVIIACVIIGAFFLSLCIQRKSFHYLGYFSGICFSLALYLSTMNEQVLRVVIQYDLYLRIRIQCLANISLLIFIVNFAVEHLSNSYNPKKKYKVIAGWLGSLVVFLILPARLIIRPSLALYLIGVLIVTAFMIYILHEFLKAAYLKLDSIEYLLVIMTSILSYWIIIFLKVIFEKSMGKLPEILIMVMLISTSLLINHRLHSDYKKAEQISEKLLLYDKIREEYFEKTSQDLKAPLYNVTDLTKGLLEGKKGPLGFEQQEDLLVVNQETQRMVRMVENLLDVSEIEKGKIYLHPGPVSPYEIVENLVEEMKSFIPATKKLELFNEVSPDIPEIFADADRFTEIIYNLLRNGIQYPGEGSLTFLAKQKDNSIIFEAASTQEGFFRDQAGQSFELDLYIIKQLVENHGGNIWLTSYKKTGTSVIFSLPVYKGEKKAKEKILNTELGIQKIEKMEAVILAVGSEKSNRDILSQIIHETGWEFIYTGKKQEMMEILEQKKVDLILLDFVVENMPAAELAKEIRRNYSMAELPIIMMCTTEKITDYADAFAMEINEVQCRPFEKEELRNRIFSLLKMKETIKNGIEKELQYFYSQISPHFLFNTLNSIIGLSYQDSEKTRQALFNLSIYFREKLNVHKKGGLIPLEAELELVQAYLEIEELRYGDKLKVEFDITENIKAKIPPLSLQPVVENAVRHGIIPKAGGGTINISVKKEGRFIMITVTDDGAGMSPEKQNEIFNGGNNRIGFINVVKKIHMLKDSGFWIESIPEKGTRVTIKIPVDTDYESNNY